jgi:hypothetical protein
MLYRDYLMTASVPASVKEPITVAARFVTVMNNTGWTISLYEGSGDQSLSSRFGFVSQYSHATIPLPNSLQTVTVAWSGGASNDKLSLIFSETNLGINQSFAPPSGISSVTITGTPGVEIVADSVGLAKEATLLGRASQTTLAALEAKDFATQTTLASRASEATLAALEAKDFATQTTLASRASEATLAALEALLTVMEANQQTMIGLLGDIKTNTTP